jgi:hypothetical protein
VSEPVEVPPLVPEAAPLAEPVVESKQENPLVLIGRRLRYWSPVIALMLLFGEMAFLGLRPALAESRRLDAAAPAVDERLARAQETRDKIDLQLRARKDPIYQERLRRLRLYPADGR